MSNVKIEINEVKVDTGKQKYTFHDWAVAENNEWIWGSRCDSPEQAVSAAQSWASQNCDSDRAEVRFVNRG